MEKYDQVACPTSMNENERRKERYRGTGKARTWEQADPAVLWDIVRKAFSPSKLVGKKWEGEDKNRTLSLKHNGGFCVLRVTKVKLLSLSILHIRIYANKESNGLVLYVHPSIQLFIFSNHFTDLNHI